MSDISLFITDRDGETHKVVAPTDMAMNLMEVIRSYELAPEGTIGVCGGMAMCASCQCYIISEHYLPEMEDDEGPESFPDPVARAIECMLDRLPEMEKEIRQLKETLNKNGIVLPDSSPIGEAPRKKING